MAGREPQGIVQRGAEYERVRAEIMERLLTLRDPDTARTSRGGGLSPRRVYIRATSLDLAPDIVFMPTRLEYFGFGEYEFGSHKIIEAMQRGISGTHRMNGVFMAYGAGVQPGTQTEEAPLSSIWRRRFCI